MVGSLVIAAFLMGLAGGPHCAAMCGAACGGVVRGAGGVRSAGSVRGAGDVRGAGIGAVGEVGCAGGVGVAGSPIIKPLPGMLQFQLGRLLGYTLAGAVCASAVESMAWLTGHASVLRPVWTLFHLAVLAWGLTLVVLARQPAWVDSAGRAAWARIRPLARARGGLVATGALWVFMPCGLLYSALLVSSLSGGVVSGALSMALFALGSGLSLGLFPGLLAMLRRAGDGLRRDWGTRAAGLLLVAAAGWALWMDLAQRVAQWCE